MERFHERHRVAGAVEEIGIAERDVLRARRHLPPDIFEHHFALHDAEDALIYGHHRAVPAEVLAAAAGLGVADAARGAVRPTSCA